ncbi:hypothetical protein [Nitrosomonas sp.]|uniref:hypothetical protein n=1 Tax=Nitrosomonas sp. TaxID=42353 RepID=UPI00374D4A35
MLPARAISPNTLAMKAASPLAPSRHTKICRQLFWDAKVFGDIATNFRVWVILNSSRLCEWCGADFTSFA